MKLAFLQYAPTYLDVAGNVERAFRLLDGLDADLVVLPELFATGYFFHSAEDLAAVAEMIPGGYVTSLLEEWCKATGTTCVAGIAEREGNRFYNSAVLVSPAGVAGTYRKTHLFYKEKLLFEPGDTGFRVFEGQTRSGERYHVGIMICFDWYFPESARTLALQGADVIAHPSNLVRKDCPRAMPIRALENRVYTITANRVGSESVGDETLTFIGQSLICGPEGEAYASAGRDEAVVMTATVDAAPARNKRINHLNDLFEDRRPSLYAGK